MADEDPLADAVVREALERSRAARLTPTQHRIIKTFIENAAGPKKAAEYILSRLRSSSSTSEEALRAFLDDWRRLSALISARSSVSDALQDLVRRRDGPRCVIAPRGDEESSEVMHPAEPAFILTPNLFCDPDLVPSGSLHPLLRAFLTDSGVDKLQALLSHNAPQDVLQNLWMVSPAFQTALRQGHVEIRPIGYIWKDRHESMAPDQTEAKYTAHPEPCAEGLVLFDGSTLERSHRFSIRSPSRDLPLPNPFLLRTQFRFASSIRLFEVEEQIAQGWPDTTYTQRFFSNRKVQLFLRAIWLLVPRFVRVMAYDYLVRAGEAKYAMDISQYVQKLPLGLYAKRLDLSQSNEPYALRLLEKHAPGVPAPLLVDTFHDSRGHERFVMTSLPGERLADVFYCMSYEERDQCADNLACVVDSIRLIPNTTPHLFCNSRGGPITDHRATSTECGPFQTEDEFDAHLTKGVSRKVKEQLSSIRSRNHRSVFTHSDLWMTNLLVQSGRLSGVVDWECAGFMPEYWEFTKAMYGCVDNDEGKEFFWRVFGDGYRDELEGERLLWPLFPFGGPDGRPKPVRSTASNTSNSDGDAQPDDDPF